MKNLKVMKIKVALLFGFILLGIFSCERDLREDAPLITLPNIAEVYTDAPVNLTDEFWLSFDSAGGANINGFSTDNNEAFEGTTSIRIDVPAANDPNGAFIGGIFRDRGDGRNLTQYDALTFWAKGSVTGTIGSVGFGTDFLDGKFPVNRNNIQLTTNWQKYVVPIPDASKLLQEKGMFFFVAAGFDILGDGLNGNEIGWTFWLDEIRFETLGTNLLVSAQMVNGQNQSAQSFTGAVIPIDGCSSVVNLGTGENVSLNFSPAYMDFNSTNPTVATTNSEGEIVVGSSGTSTITASLNDLTALGSIEVNSAGALPLAENPTSASVDVKSIFSDVYTPVTTINVDPQFGGSTTQVDTFTQPSSSSPSGTDSVLVYNNNNFTGITFQNTIDASNLSYVHFDIYVQDITTSVEFQIRDIGANGEINTNSSTGAPEQDDVDYRRVLTGLEVNQWNSINIPLSGDLATQRDNLGAIILVGGPNFILDNIYFYSIEPTNNVNDSGATQAELPIGFESSVTYSFFGFGGAVSAIESNPDQSGINTTSTVVRSIKTNGAQFFAGTLFDLDVPIDISNSKKIRLKVWSPKANIPVSFALDIFGGSIGQADQIIVDANIPIANEWVELEFDFTGVYNPSIVYQRFTVFFEFINGLSGDGSTYYFDDVKILE